MRLVLATAIVVLAVVTGVAIAAGIEAFFVVVVVAIVVVRYRVITSFSGLLSS